MNKFKLFLSTCLSLILVVPPILVNAQTLPIVETSNQGNYLIINNESTNKTSSEYSGTFTIKNQNYTLNRKISPSAYRVDVNKPFNYQKNKNLQVRKSLIPARSSMVGDSKLFWVTDFTTNRNYQISTKLLYSGTHSDIWVYNNQLTSSDAQKLGQEFDNKIRPVVTTNFGTESDVDGNGKVNILCFDIQDGFSGSGGYIGGYFYAGDLYTNSTSNQSEIFYMDTYPAMGTGTVKDVTKAYGTLAHEFQHMVNFNRNVFIEGGTTPMDTWMDEGMAMAAEQIYSGQALSDRIQYYNSSNSITNGHSLLYWDDSGDVLSNYSLSYLFFQYLKIQANQGDKIFKEILENPYNDYRGIEDVVNKHIDSTMSFGHFLTKFREALLLNEPTGLDGFKGISGFTDIQPKLYTGSGINLYGGGAIVKQINPLTQYPIPSDKGTDITYTFLSPGSGTGGGVGEPPSILSINPVSDRDTIVSGTAAAKAKVYVLRGTTQLGTAVADSSGKFSISIAKQKGGTILTAYAEDAAGNMGEAFTVKVKDTYPPSLPTVNPVGDNQTTVTGSAEARTKAVVISGTSILGQETVSSTGAFSVSIAKQKTGTKLAVYVQDSGGNKSGTVSVTVLDKTPPVKPVLTSVGDNQSIITGKTEAGAKVLIKSGTTLLGQAYASSTGSFVIKISAIQKAGTTLTVYANDKAGNQIKTTTIVVDKTPPAAPIINKVTYATTTVTGKAEAGSTVYLFNGVSLIGKTVSDQYGNFKASIRAQKTGTVLTGAAIDKSGNQSKLVTLKVY